MNSSIGELTAAAREPPICATPIKENAMPSDTDKLEDIAKALSHRLGREVRIDKVFNRIGVYAVTDVAFILADVTEQELLAYDGNPIEMLVSAATVEIPMPPYISLKREEMLRSAHWVAAPVGAKEYTLMVSTPEGPAPLYTLSSDKFFDPRLARNDLARLLSKPKDATLVILHDIKEYQDVFSKEAAAWVDGVFLEGQWELDAERKLVRVIAASL